MPGCCRPRGREAGGEGFPRDPLALPAGAGLQPSLTREPPPPATGRSRHSGEGGVGTAGPAPSTALAFRRVPGAASRPPVFLTPRVGTERLWPKAASRMLPPFSLLGQCKSCLRKQLEEALPFSHYTKVCFCRGRPGGCRVTHQRLPPGRQQRDGARMVPGCTLVGTEAKTGPWGINSAPATVKQHQVLVFPREKKTPAKQTKKPKTPEKQNKTKPQENPLHVQRIL